MKVCSICRSPVKQGSTGDWFHATGDPLTETIARMVKDEDEPERIYPVGGPIPERSDIGSGKSSGGVINLMFQRR